MQCMGVHPNRVPKIYECDQCNPRPLNKEAAVQHQLLLREEESSSSDEEADRAQPAAPRKTHNPKRARSRKASSNSMKSEESSADVDDRLVQCSPRKENFVDARCIVPFRLKLDRT